MSSLRANFQFAHSLVNSTLKTMKSVENLLHAYFLIKNPSAKTIIYDARHKVCQGVTS
jgi:hypothetical protein